MNSLEKLIQLVEQVNQGWPEEFYFNDWEKAKQAVRADWEAFEAFQEESKHNAWERDLQD